MHPSGDDDGSVCVAEAQRAAREFVRSHPLTRPYYEDILSDALLGAAGARASYDPTRGVPFGVYALRRARGAVLDGARTRSPFTRGEHANGMTAENAPPHRQPAVNLSDRIPTQRSPYEQADARIDLARLLKRLPPRLALIVRAYDLDGLTLLEISKALGVSESRVCQLRAQAFRLARTA